MVIYDQRTAISATRLSANASLMFSSLSHLFLAAPFLKSLAKLCIYAPAASTILGVFPSPPSWRRPFPKHTKPGRICADICCSAGEVEKEMEPFSRKLSSVHLLSLSVRLHRMHFCVARSVRCRCDTPSTKCPHVCLDSDYIVLHAVYTATTLIHGEVASSQKVLLSRTFYLLA